ncbi:hypothetical protein HL667_10660 [Bradyrhizobium sp. 83012]|uniref:Uncharacterized protein n=1 Tax=Bradyrhizobium aeschynomenes TaxID=2734909 RepID=A0ABX2CDU3_9BRAD|nr:hypothetical protein [Bradyrhizobium aeschynomenes]NPU65454.1 hypothetical protein [Bradyrhizobium aeschynomenes]
MRRMHPHVLGLALASAVISSSRLEAATFEPKIEEVCSVRAGTRQSVLDPRKLVSRLLEKNAGISSIDLDSSGEGVVFPDTARALLEPTSFCAGGRCSKGTPASLGLALVELQSFVDRNATGPRTPPYIDTTALNSKPAELRHFLLGRSSSQVLCVLAPDPAPPATVAATALKGPTIAGVEWKDIPHYFALRQNIEDLAIPQDDERFPGVKRASISWMQDRVADRSSFGINLAAGYTVGRLALDEGGRWFGRVTPFLTYDQQLVQASTRTTRAENVGAGFMGDLTLPAFGSGSQNIAAFPKYVRSLSTDAQVLSGNFVYTPMYGIPGVDSIFYLVPEVLSFQFTPKFKVVYNDVREAGSSTLLSPRQRYYWYGPQLSLAVYGEGVLAGFTYTAGYEWYQIVGGPLPNVSLFQTALNYDIGKSKLVSVQLKYQNGRNLDTLEPIDQITLGLGVKY